MDGAWAPSFFDTIHILHVSIARHREPIHTDYDY